MRVDVLKTFLHGTDRFEAGEKIADEPDAPAEFRQVSTEDIHFFRGAGWVRAITVGGPAVVDASSGAVAEIVGLTAHPPQG
jgi:hypothetical protein